MQYVRGQVTSIRPQPYIESAQATGLRQPQIIFRHVLPNLLAALLGIAALEMGAVLLLLAELGFVGIFIGGGAFADLDTLVSGGTGYHYSDVPEWGSMLANVRVYRSQLSLDDYLSLIGVCYRDSGVQFAGRGSATAC